MSAFGIGMIVAVALLGAGIAAVVWYVAFGGSDDDEDDS